MRARIERGALRDALRIVLPASKGSSLPVLSGVRIEAAEGLLSLTCSNLDLTAETTVTADIGETGIVVAPASLLSRFVSAAPAGHVELVSDGSTIEISCNEAHASFPLLEADDWPRVGPADAEPVSLTAEHVESIRRVLAAASTDTERPLLRTVHVIGDRVEATDSYRGMAATLPGVDIPEASMPAESLASVLKVTTGSLDLIIGDRSATLADNDSSWTMRLVGGAFPNLRGLFEGRATSPYRLTFDAERMIEAIERAAILDAGTRAIAIVRDGDKLIVSIDATDAGSISDVLPCTGDFEQPFGVAARYLIEALRAARTDDVTLEMVDNLKPIVLSSENFVQLLMPVKPK